MLDKVFLLTQYFRPLNCDVNKWMLLKFRSWLKNMRILLIPTYIYWGRDRITDHYFFSWVPNNKEKTTLKIQNNDNHKHKTKTVRQSHDAFLVFVHPPASFIFCFLYSRREKDQGRGQENKEEAAAAVTAADKEASRNKVSAEKLAAIKSTKEKEKAPAE